MRHTERSRTSRSCRNSRVRFRHAALIDHSALRACIVQFGSYMPERETIKRAKRDLRRGKSASTAGGEFVREEMHHIRAGKHGARSTKQAIAIGLSKARRAGVKLPPNPNAKGSTAKRAHGKPSRTRSRAISRALKREPHRAASHAALAAHAKTSARQRGHAALSAAAHKAARTRKREA
jgi:hypothetical protein